jgi:RNA polymerase sigma-70 factor (ECF subfamily)
VTDRGPGPVDPGTLLDHFFRRESARLTARLARVLGTRRLDLAEESVQEALVRALRAWPLRGIPENPAGWLFRVARNHAVDVLRREARARRDSERIARLLESSGWAAAAPSTPGLDPDADRWGAGPTSGGRERGERARGEHGSGKRASGERGSGKDRSAEALLDDQARMMFLCCHPSLPRTAQVALTLKIVCGFGVAEIARAFFATEPAIAQRIVRAKARLRRRRASLRWPEPDLLEERVDAVLETLYLLFNEGYTCHDGPDVLRADLMDEAIRLAVSLADHPACGRPAAHALVALMWFQSSRLAARVGPGGELLPIAEQDRSLWDATRIGMGFERLERAREGAISRYHLLAGIAACHASARGPGETDWARVVFFYDLLLQLSEDPVTRLNRAVAVSMAQGPEAALPLLDRLAEEPVLRGGYLLPAARADCLERLGRRNEAVGAFRLAAARAPTGPERRWFEKKAGGAT